MLMTPFIIRYSGCRGVNLFTEGRVSPVPCFFQGSISGPMSFPGGRLLKGRVSRR